MKVCCHCHRELDESCFSKKSSEKDGLRRECKECMREYKKRYVTENREEYLKKRHEYDAKNAEKKKEYRKRNYEKHREEQIEYSRNYRIENRDKYLETQRKSEEKRRGTRTEYIKLWYEKNRDTALKRNREYYENHKDYFKEYNKDYSAKRRSEDEMYKFKQDMRSLIGISFRKKGWKKNSKTQDVIGCTFEEAKEHLERTWFENYGTQYNGEPVHIDHIIPISTAKTKEDVIKLCHISNLQYLRPSDNMSKQDKIAWELDDGSNQMRFL